MAEQNKVEDVEKIYVEPAGGENVDDPKDPKDGNAEGADGDQGDGGEGSGDGAAAGRRQPKEQLIDNSKNKPVAQAGETAAAGGEGSAAAGAAADDGKGKVGPDGLRDVPGETPRERALRAQLTETRKQLRSERGQELGLNNAPQGQQPAKREPSAQAVEVLKKYPAKEIQALREVLPALADEMGYVKATDLTQQNYAQQGQTVLDDFLEAHPEYSAENDKDGVLWKAFQNEFQLYQKPANPKDFQKIFNRIHTTIFGIKPAGDNGAITAAQQKINVASHAGASGPSRSNAAPRSSAASAGLRLDMLKGFSDEEKDDIAGRAG